MDTMYEIINKIDGENIPQLVIVDESVRKDFVSELVRRGKIKGYKTFKKMIVTVYAGNSSGLEKGIADEDIVEFGRTVGCPYIITNDFHFYRFKDSYGKNEDGHSKIIVLKNKSRKGRNIDSNYNYLRMLRDAGFDIGGNGLTKVSSFG